MNSTSTVAGCS